MAPEKGAARWLGNGPTGYSVGTRLICPHWELFSDGVSGVSASLRWRPIRVSPAIMNIVSILSGVEAVTQDLSGCGLSFVGSSGGQFVLPDKSRPIEIKVLSPNCRECRVLYGVRGSARKYIVKQNLRLGWLLPERTADARRLCPADRGPERRSRKLPQRQDSAALRSKRDQTVPANARSVAPDG